MEGTTTRYRVTAPYVTVRTTTATGFTPSHRHGTTTMVGLHRNALLPDDVPADDIDRLLRKGLIEGIEVTA